MKSPALVNSSTAGLPSSSSDRKPIRQLSASMVNKIAAGEVIERPASVVKELLENSVDAGATRIELVVENGGADLIRVVDNGHGIDPDDMPLAVTSHATSKIADVDDLFAVSTMGFRGEALASITEISQARIRSRTGERDAGYELSINGGSAEPLVPCGCAIGTTIEIANLFFNTPVRRKFLKTSQTEMGHIVEAFTRIALPNPQIHMTLKHNQRVVQDLPATSSWLERIQHFFGEDVSRALIPVHGERDGIRLSGLVADPSISRANNRMQYLFLNRRHIRDRSLQHALSEAYRGLLMTGRYPVVFLQLEMPADLVDINVHPAKLEVRFQDGGRVYSHLLATIRNRFLTTDLTARTAGGQGHTTSSPQVAPSSTPSPGLAPSSDTPSYDTPSSDTPAADQSHHQTPQLAHRQDQAVGMDELARERLRNSFSSSAAGTNSNWQQSSLSLPSQQQDWSASLDPSPAAASHSPARHSAANRGASQIAETASAQSTHPIDSDQRWATDYPTTQADPPTQTHSALQIHHRYLVTQNDEGMVVIDQHALHERIIYEQIRDKVLQGRLETQQLLVPEPVSLTASEAATVLAEQEQLARIGIIVEPFGGDSVLVTGYPAMLTNHNPGETLRGIVDLLMADGKQPERRDVLDSLLHMISCKAAVKAGDKLTADEIEALLRDRDLCQDAHHCPHGRPTALVFSRQELDKRFKRI